MSRRLLHLSSAFTLPPEWMMAATVVYGGKGAGKTTFASVVAEEVHKLGQRFCVIDLKGDFWGLKSSADGKTPMIPAVIFGGDHADAPLEGEPGAGKFMGELVPTLDQSVILDFEHLSKGKQIRFLGEFFAALYHTNRQPLLVIMDEVQRYAPQKTFAPESAACLGAVEDIVKLGRKHGLGVLAITQRGAGLNKEVSELCEMMVALRTSGSLDQERVRGWLEANFPKEEIGQVIEQLSSFKDGQAVFACANPKMKVYEVAQTRHRETFDSSATPEIGQRPREPKVLAQADLEQIHAQMAEAVERQKAADPKALRQEVARLKAALDKAARPSPVQVVQVIEPPAPQIKRVEVPVLKDEDVKRFERACERMQKKLDEHVAELLPLQERLNAATNNILTKMAAAVAQGRDALKPRVAQAVKKVAPAPPNGHRLDQIPASALADTKSIITGIGGVTNPQQRILDALAWFGMLGVREPSRAAVAFVARTRPTSGGYKNNVYSLKVAGLIRYPRPSDLALTDAGEAAAVTPVWQPTPDAVQTAALEMVSKPQGAILRALIERYPDGYEREQLAEAVVVSASSGGFKNNIYALHTLELVTYPNKGLVRAADLLFVPEARS